MTLDVPLVTGSKQEADSGIALSDPAVINAVEKVSTNGASELGFWTSSTGIRFKLYKVNRLLALDAGNRIVEPSIPTFYDDRNDRWLPNPSDPDYIKSIEEANLKRGLVVANVYLALGSKPVGDLPESIIPFESMQWAEDLQELGLEIPSSPKMRYVNWLKYHALGDPDFTGLTLAVMEYSGHVREETVQAAEDSFRDNSERGADTAGAVASENKSRDIIRQGDGTSTGLRVQGGSEILPANMEAVPSLAEQRTSDGNSTVQDAPPN